MEMPPVSKVTPLPMKQIGFSVFFLLPFHFITTMRGSMAEPMATPSRAPKPSFFISLRPRISTVTPSASSPRQRSAISTGWSTFGGSLTRSRERKTPSATARKGA